VEISRWVQEHGHTLPVHPTQLYESVGQLVLFLAFLGLRARRRFHGQLFGMWLVAYALLRSSVEYFRGDAERGTLHGLIDAIPPTAWYNISTGQAISLGLMAVGVTVLYRQRKARPVG
jgi:phosphatidylglycerol:prolipoprotein diacylglycerol transferase